MCWPRTMLTLTILVCFIDATLCMVSSSLSLIKVRSESETRKESATIEKLEVMLNASYRCISKNNGNSQCPGLIEYYRFLATLDGTIFRHNFHVLMDVNLLHLRARRYRPSPWDIQIQNVHNFLDQLSDYLDDEANVKPGIAIGANINFAEVARTDDEIRQHMEYLHYADAIATKYDDVFKLGLMFDKLSYYRSLSGKSDQMRKFIIQLEETEVAVRGIYDFDIHRVIYACISVPKKIDTTAICADYDRFLRLFVYEIFNPGSTEALAEATQMTPPGTRCIISLGMAYMWIAHSIAVIGANLKTNESQTLKAYERNLWLLAMMGETLTKDPTRRISSRLFSEHLERILDSLEFKEGMASIRSKLIDGGELSKKNSLQMLYETVRLKEQITANEDLKQIATKVNALAVVAKELSDSHGLSTLEQMAFFYLDTAYRTIKPDEASLFEDFALTNQSVLYLLKEAFAEKSNEVMWTEDLMADITFRYIASIDNATERWFALSAMYALLTNLDTLRSSSSNWFSNEMVVRIIIIHNGELDYEAVSPSIQSMRKTKLVQKIIKKLTDSLPNGLALRPYKTLFKLSRKLRANLSAPSGDISINTFDLKSMAAQMVSLRNTIVYSVSTAFHFELVAINNIIQVNPQDFEAALVKELADFEKEFRLEASQLNLVRQAFKKSVSYETTIDHLIFTLYLHDQKNMTDFLEKLNLFYVHISNIQIIDKIRVDIGGMSMATMQNIHYFMSYLEENNYDKLIRKTKNQLVASLYILAKYTKTVTELSLSKYEHGSGKYMILDTIAQLMALVHKGKADITEMAKFDRLSSRFKACMDEEFIDLLAQHAACHLGRIMNEKQHPRYNQLEAYFASVEETVSITNEVYEYGLGLKFRWMDTFEKYIDEIYAMSTFSRAVHAIEILFFVFDDVEKMEVFEQEWRLLPIVAVLQLTKEINGKDILKQCQKSPLKFSQRFAEFEKKAKIVDLIGAEKLSDFIETRWGTLVLPKADEVHTVFGVVISNGRTAKKPPPKLNTDDNRELCHLWNLSMLELKTIKENHIPSEESPTIWTKLNNKYARHLYIIGAEIFIQTAECPTMPLKGRLNSIFNPYQLFGTNEFEEHLDDDDFENLKKNSKFMVAARKINDKLIEKSADRAQHADFFYEFTNRFMYLRYDNEQLNKAIEHIDQIRKPGWVQSVGYQSIVRKLKTWQNPNPGAGKIETF